MTKQKTSWFGAARRTIAAGCAAVAVVGARPAIAAGGIVDPRLILATRHIEKLEVAEAGKVLADIPEEGDALIVHTLLALYTGDCDRAVALIEKASTGNEEAARFFGGVARGCAMVTASTVTVTDEAAGVSIRLKDDDDAPLVPYLVEVLGKALASLERDLGVTMPRPVRIELVRDHHSLSAITGLSLEAAQNTGTLAVAKWGRVTMLSPRAIPHGYAWADTLMHELTHLAVTRASADEAPLWLQEGVAKRQEPRWRAPFLYDGQPSPDAIAVAGFKRNLGLGLDQLGPSIAMLPSAEQAGVAFAEVTSFVHFWTKEAGDGALPKLLVALDTPGRDVPIDETLKTVSGADLKGWDARWRAHLAEAAPPLPPDTFLSPPSPKRKELARRSRLGDLLAARDHHAAAVKELERAVSAAPTDPSGHARLAASLAALGQKDRADKEIATLESVNGAHAGYLALHAAMRRAAGDEAGAAIAADHALWNGAYDPAVACAGAAPGELPAEPKRRALCEAAREVAKDLGRRSSRH